MAKADFGPGTIAKSALIWLTAGVLFASMFGMLLTAGTARSSVSFADPSPDAVMAVNDTKTAG